MVRGMSLLEEARRALEEAERELQRYLKTKEKVVFRDACEKAWMATFLATDHLLMVYGFEKPRSGNERRRGLVELEKRVSKAKELGLRDRFGSRAYHLHSIGFYEGLLEVDELKLEIEKVREYLEIVEELSRRQLQRNPP